MSASYCELKELMSKCTVHIHRKANPKLEYSMCQFYKTRSPSDSGCLFLRREMNYHCDSMDAQKGARKAS